MDNRIPTFYKILAAAVLVPLAALLALTIALRIWLPPEKVRGLIVEQAEKFLHREVRLKGVGLGVVKGLVVQGLEVSEKPDFKAGTFAGVESLRLRIQWLPLLRKKVVIDEITVAGPSVAVVLLKPGVFNFSDLIAAAPAQAKPAAEAPGPALPFDLQAGKIALEDGRLDYEDKVSGTHWRLLALHASIKGMSLAMPFDVEGGLKAQQVAPGSLKAKLEFDGQADVSGLSSGKLSASIRKLSADVSGLTLSLSGPVRLDPDRIEAPALKGKLGKGTLEIRASVLDYSKAPDARLEASLSELDAAQLLAVKAAAAGPAPARAAPAGKTAAKAPAGPAAPPMKTSGKVKVGKILYHTFKADDLALSWDLKGITPDLRGLSGWAKLSAGGGTFAPEESAGGRSPLMSALLIPLTVLKQVGRVAGALKILPPFDQLAFSGIKGDYVFTRGLMTIREFRMDSAAADVSAAGTIDLPGEKLALQVTIALAQLAPVVVDVGGTFAEPKPKLRLTKALAEPVKKLAQPAMDLLKGLFKRK